MFDKAKARGTHVLVMPPGMSKRKGNTTYYTAKSNAIAWKVHLVFIVGDSYAIPSLFNSALDNVTTELNVDGSLVGITLPNVIESTTIEQLIGKFFDPTPTNTVQRHALRPLRLKRDDIRCLIQRIPSPTADPTFAEVLLTSSLKDALVGKTVVEYPTFFLGYGSNTAKLKRFVGIIGEGENANADQHPGSSSGPVDADVSGLKRKVEGAQDIVLDMKRPKVEEGLGDGIDGREDEDGDDDDDDVIEGDGDVNVISKKHGHLGLTANVFMDVDEVDEEDSEHDEDFLKALQEFESKDISSLRQFIMSQEEGLLSDD
jgi:hypothetical protein